MEEATTRAALEPASETTTGFEAHYGLLLVIVAPALFWAALAFGIAYLAGSASAPTVATTVFVASSAFLIVVTRALRIRL